MAKEKPILFSTQMVQAILSGVKTQTRRVVKPCKLHAQKRPDGLVLCRPSGQNHSSIDIKENGAIWYPYAGSGDQPCPLDVLQKYCPYGQVGDELWVRETFAHYAGQYVYKATPHTYPQATTPDFKFKPSIHMPRTASRIQLRINDIKIERLQEISSADAISEGVGQTSFWKPNEMEDKPFEEKWWDDYHFWTHYPQIVFQRLWDSINNIRGYGWDTNPWVWVVSFEKMEGGE